MNQAKQADKAMSKTVGERKGEKRQDMMQDNRRGMAEKMTRETSLGDKRYQSSLVRGQAVLL